MKWIESHHELSGHIKTKRLARRLGISVPAAIGHLHLLWWWASRYASNGNLAGFDHEEIADEAQWDGEPGAFVSALISAEFIDETPAGLEIHDWYTYWGKYLDDRERRAKHMRDKRAARVTNEDGTLPSRDGNEEGTLPTTRQDNTKQDKDDKTPAGKITHIDDARKQELAEGFSAFWDAYPRKTGEDIASTAWFTLKPSAELRATIMDALEKHKASQEWADEGGRYIPSPGKWLGERRWRDELTPARPKNPNRAFYGDGRLAL